MQAIKSVVNPQDETYQTNYAANSSAVEKLKSELARSTKGGGEHYVKRHLARGRLLPRERIEMLLDEGSYFLEIAPLAGIGMENEFVGRGVEASVWSQAVSEFIANEATVKGGAAARWAQRIAASRCGTDNHFQHQPVESAGADFRFKQDLCARRPRRSGDHSSLEDAIPRSRCVRNSTAAAHTWMSEYVKW